MKPIALIALALLAACANRAADPNPDSVPNIQQTMIDMRASGPHISVAGGVFDGAAAGQLTSFVATPDGRLVCTFQNAPDPNRSGLTATVTGYRLNVAGIFAGLTSVVQPNIESSGNAATQTFTIRTGSGLDAPSTSITRSDPRHAALMNFFAANPTPCWTFG